MGTVMGSGEEGKPSKLAASTQETPSTHSYPDWATPVQAYYGSGATPPSFFQSPVPSSPMPHPYLWGGQHLMPPYGTPLPYPALYAHGGIYAHPSMTPVPVTSTSEAEGKASDDKARGLVKKSKGGTGNLGFNCGKSGDGGKTGSGSGNEGISHSGESGSEDSSDASEDNENRHDIRRRAFDQMIVDGANAQLNNAAQYIGRTGESCLTGQGQTAVPPATVPGNPAGPTTNLNIGMDLWNASPAGAVNVKARSAAAGVSPAIVPTPIIAREGVPSDLWIQDERELKRQRRKQSNRESARRSRLRKQAECEELAAKVELLNTENQNLRTELQQLSDECEKLTSENASILEQLSRYYGPEALSMLDQENADTITYSAISNEGNGHPRIENHHVR
ncbi:G-box-binding factor 1 [Nymphaea thermarum]|nr:G-box-binding factor 1 [Nymphaea thermarum]